MSQLNRSIRLLGRPGPAITKAGGAPGEIFYDTTNQTLRFFNRGSSSLLATEAYVNTAIDNIPEVDFTGLATETYVNNLVSNTVNNLVDTAPDTLNTLNELAAALGDDANFATTVVTALGTKAPLNNPSFTGTVNGITAAMVGLGNVTNESKATMFASPTFTGTVSGVTASMVGLGNVTNESKSTMFNNPTFTGLTTFQQSSEVVDSILGALDTVTHNFSNSAIWVHTGHSTFTPNFINIPTTSYRAITVTLILNQAITPFVPLTIQVNSSPVTINWVNGDPPIGTALAKDIVSFTLVREIGDWTAFGSVSSYKAL